MAYKEGRRAEKGQAITLDYREEKRKLEIREYKGILWSEQGL